MDANQMRVILGASSLRLYVAAPKAFNVLGIVRFGMEYGLLAKDADGLYFCVNGSQGVVLNSRQVHSAMDRSDGLGGWFAASSAAFAATHTIRNPWVIPKSNVIPQVSIRKHRWVLDFTLHNNHGHASRRRLNVFVLYVRRCTYKSSSGTNNVWA